MRECQNCGSKVTEDFARVFFPSGSPVKKCIYCETKMGFDPGGRDVK